MNPILIDAERTRKIPSGLQQYCDLLIEGLTSIRDDFDVYTSPNLPLHPSRIRPFHTYHRIFNPFPRPYRLMHITHQAQVYLPFSPRDGKVLLTIHDINYIHHATSPYRLKSFISTVRRNIRRANHIVCISEFVREDLMAHSHLFPEVKDCPISVIHNGLKFDTLAAPLHEFLPSKSYILNIGQAIPKKNQLSLVRMLPYIPMDLVCIVDRVNASYAIQLKEAARELGVERRIWLMEKVSEGEKQSLLKHAVAYVHPSLAEGFGYPPIEAMYHGTPVFLSRLCSLPEIGGEYAYYFDDFDPQAMALLLHNGLEEHASDIRRPNNLRQHALQFDYHRMAAKYSRLYDQILGL